ITAMYKQRDFTQVHLAKPIAAADRYFETVLVRSTVEIRLERLGLPTTVTFVGNAVLRLRLEGKIGRQLAFQRETFATERTKRTAGTQGNTQQARPQNGLDI